MRGSGPYLTGFTAGRAWLANTEQNPNKLRVSRRTEGITKINLSAYNVYGTAAENFTAFSGRNKTGASLIEKLDGNGHLLRSYTHKEIKHIDEGEGKSGSGVDYGTDKCFINRTTYFRDKRYRVLDANPNLSAEEPGVAADDEYTEEETARTEAEYTRKMNRFQPRLAIPVPAAGFVSFNCYRIEGFLRTTAGSYGQFSINGWGGVFGSHAVQALPLFPFTERGENGPAIPGIAAALISPLVKYKIPGFTAGIDPGNPNIEKANAGISANFLLKIAEGAAQISAALAEILIIYNSYVEPVLNDGLKLPVTLANGEEKTFAPADLGISGRHPDYLNHILQYIKTKLFCITRTSPLRVFITPQAARNTPQPAAGFTFEIAGGTGEFIYDIAENQEIIIQTAKSERMAGYGINGEAQKVIKISGEGCEFVKGAFTGGALYSMRAGSRSLQKLQREPAMNAPVTRQANQRNTGILDGFITRFLYASETYPKKIRLISAAGEVRAVQLLFSEAFYRESACGQAADMQCFKAGQDEVYIIRKDAAGRRWLDRLVDKIGRHGKIRLRLRQF